MGPRKVFISDFDASVQRLGAAAPGREEFRRALKEVLNEVYAFWDYRGREHGDRDAYLQLARQEPAGRTTEGLCAVRSIPTHNPAYLTQILPESRVLFPGADVFPGEHLYPGANLYWLHAEEMRDPPPKLAARVAKGFRDPGPSYADVAGRLVFETLADARDWLLSPA